MIPSLVVAGIMVRQADIDNNSVTGFERVISVDNLTQEINILFPSISDVKIGTLKSLDKNGRIIFSAWNYNNGGIDLKYGVHTVYIEKGSSNIVIYNCYNSWTEPETSYASIEDMFSSSDPLFSTLVIGIWY